MNGFRVFDIEVGKQIRRFRVPTGVDIVGPENVQIIENEDSIMASCSEILVWDWKTEKIIFRLHSERSVSKYCISGDKKWLASNGDDRFLLIWDFQAIVSAIKAAKKH